MANLVPDLINVDTFLVLATLPTFTGIFESRCFRHKSPTLSCTSGYRRYCWLKLLLKESEHTPVIIACFGGTLKTLKLLRRQATWRWIDARIATRQRQLGLARGLVLSRESSALANPRREIGCLCVATATSQIRHERECTIKLRTIWVNTTSEPSTRPLLASLQHFEETHTSTIVHQSSRTFITTNSVL